ncbi:MAG: patatin-like phospholipase family protein [Anaerolineae bacterium]|nr:patatin-like phospholipase family protein [Anaerolineae bacterium]
MSKVALVLSGGGARGAFQFAAEKYAREVKGYRWDLIAGVSVGALNGAMLAMGKYGRLEDLWANITADQVYTGKMGVWAILKLLFGARSIYGHEPLRELIEREIDLGRIVADLRIGTVSLRTGEYVRFTPSDPGFREALLASTAIPIIWPPVHVPPSHLDMVDGGVRNVSPLGDVLDADPTEVVVINCGPRKPPRSDEPLNNALQIGQHALEIALDEIFTTDVREFVRINRNVQEAAAHGVTLHNDEGKPYRYYQCAIIEPDEPLGDTLDFDRSSIYKRMRAGWEKAREVLG